MTEKVLQEFRIIETDDGFRIEIKGDKEALRDWVMGLDPRGIGRGPGFVPGGHMPFGPPWMRGRRFGRRFGPPWMWADDADEDDDDGDEEAWSKRKRGQGRGRGRGGHHEHGHGPHNVETGTDEA